MRREAELAVDRMCDQMCQIETLPFLELDHWQCVAATVARDCLHSAIWRIVDASRENKPIANPMREVDRQREANHRLAVASGLA